MIEVKLVRSVEVTDHGGDTLRVQSLTDGDDECAVTITAQGVHLSLDELCKLGHLLVEWAAFRDTLPATD